MREFKSFRICSTECGTILAWSWLGYVLREWIRIVISSTFDQSMIFSLAAFSFTSVIVAAITELPTLMCKPLIKTGYS